MDADDDGDEHRHLVADGEAADGSLGTVKGGKWKSAPDLSELVGFEVIGTREEVLACLHVQAVWRRKLEAKRRRGRQNAQRTMKRINSADKLRTPGMTPSSSAGTLPSRNLASVLEAAQQALRDYDKPSPDGGGLPTRSGDGAAAAAAPAADGETASVDDADAAVVPTDETRPEEGVDEEERAAEVAAK